MLKLDNFLI